MSSLAKSLGSIDVLTITLHRLMDERKLTEAELARRTNIPQPTLHKILSGKTGDPRASTLKSLADFFGVTIDMLLTGNATTATPVTASTTKTQSIPIISWTDCLQLAKLMGSLNSTNWDHWITTEYSSATAYALSSKPSMEPRLPKGSTLIIDPNINPEDGDLVIVHFPNTNEATLRELSIDGPIKQLIPICRNSPPEPWDSNINVLGVLTKSIFKFH